MPTFNTGTFFRYLDQDIGKVNNIDIHMFPLKHYFYDSPEPAVLHYCRNSAYAEERHGKRGMRRVSRNVKCYVFLDSRSTDLPTGRQASGMTTVNTS